MALATRPPVQERPARRIWKTPGSKLNWLFLGLSLVTLASIALLFRQAIATQLYPGPYNAPFREFGIVSFALVLITAAYTLRRRFARGLPGKVQNWLWAHIWFGIISALIACMHETFQNITNNFLFTGDRFTEDYFGTTALYALIVLVLTGVIGRLLDMWQARVIAAEAGTNGVGIHRSLEERLFELALAVERLSAGKSQHFKAYCQEALARNGSLPRSLPVLSSDEVSDFQRAHEALNERLCLAQSLQRQRRAQRVIRAWCYIHIPLAVASVALISYHSLIELYMMVFLHY